MNFPVHYAWIRPLDSKGRGLVIRYDMPAPCGEVWIDPGDLILQIFDGIVVIPKKIEQEVVSKS